MVSNRIIQLDMQHAISGALLALLLQSGCQRAHGEPIAHASGHQEDSAASLAVLRQALQSKDYETRLLAVQAVGDTRSPDLVAWLEHTLGDPEHDVRVATLDALGRIPSQRARELIRSVRDDTTEKLDVRALAAGLLLSRGAN